MKNYARIAHPLTNLTRKGIPGTWGIEENISFEKLKEVLISRPGLSIYSPSAATELHTDAGSLGIASSLLQYQTDDKLHPRAYCSR